MGLKNILSKYWNRLRGNSHMIQASKLFIWNLVSMPINLAVNFFVTRYLGAEQYGNYSFIQKIFELAFILLNFGFFRSVGRAVLLAKDEKEVREYYGSGALIWLITSMVINIVLYAYVIISPNIAEKGILTVMLCVIPLSSIHYLANIYEQILPSNNEINLLIKERYFPRIALLLAIAFVFFIVPNITENKLTVAISLLFGTQFIVYLYIFVKLAPVFANIRERFREVYRINKEYGLQVYLGDLSSNAISALTPILISFFCIDNTDVGFYTLAYMLCSPMNVIPSVLMTSHYKKFSTQPLIPFKYFKLTVGSSLLCLICLWIIITPFVNLFYTSEFHPVILLTIITSIGTFCYGFSDFLSRYLASQGDGVALRNSSIIVGLTTLLCSLLIIPKYGAMGAAITHVIVGLVYVVVIFLYYKKRIKLNKI